MNLITNLMKLGKLLDDDTTELFGKFCEVALMSDDVSKFVKEALRKALADDRKPEPVTVTATPVEPEPTPRARTRVRRNPG